MPMSQSASSSPTPRTTSRVMMTGLIGSDLRRKGLLVWSIARRLNAATERAHARPLFGATHAFNPKYNDFGFDSDQVSKLDNANLKTWPMSPRRHFRPPESSAQLRNRIGRGECLLWVISGHRSAVT